MMKYGVLGSTLQLSGIEVVCTRCNRRSWTTQATPTLSECCHAQMRKTGRFHAPSLANVPRTSRSGPHDEPGSGGTIPFCHLPFVLKDFSE